MWDLTTALDQYHANLSFSSVSVSNQANTVDKTSGTVSSTTTASNANAVLFTNRASGMIRQVSFFKKKFI